ncbi:TonB-dependent receptor [Rhodoferax sp. GW822-FHT02A01]|uniref:TonB-dependent receptor n=1 Tax=Rhodoferax sp. GW822-FHT02A01 TaxID=3141537 RepID=UPI00315D4F50
MKSRVLGARVSVLGVALCAAYSMGAEAQSVNLLREVVVTASRFSESVDALPYGVSVITAQEIEASGATSVSEAIMKILGVPGRLDTSGGNNYAVDLRGFGQTSDSNQVVILDGRRLNEQDLSGTNMGIIPIESVQRIEVIRGNAAVMYGEGATGGAILISTKAGQGVERHNAAVVSASTGSYGLQELRTSATVAAGAVSLDVAGSERKSDGHRDNFASTNNNLDATVQWSNDWLRVGAQAARNLLHSGLPGSLTAAQYDADPHTAKSMVNYGQIKSEVYGVFAEAILEDWKLGFDYGERNKKQAYYSPSYYSDANVDAISANLRARNERKGETFANVFTVGADMGDWKYDDLAPSKARSQSNAIYITDDISYLPSGTRLSLGVRNETVKKTRDGVATGVDDSQTAWDVGLTQDLGQGVHVYGRTGQSFRFANVDEINFVTPGTSLKPQTSKDVELGARWQYAKGRAELRWYRSDLNNEIGYDGTAIGPNSVFGYDGANVNFDPTRREGVEFEGRHDISTSVALRVNAAARQARFVSGQYADKDVALVPAHTAGLGLDWKVAAGHLLNFGVNWVSSQSPDFANKCTMPSYTTVDARYSYSMKSAEFALGVSNLGDTKYYTQAYGCTAAGVTTSIYPEAGRAVTATAKLKF